MWVVFTHTSEFILVTLIPSVVDKCLSQGILSTEEFEDILPIFLVRYQVCDLKIGGPTYTIVS